LAYFKYENQNLVSIAKLIFRNKLQLLPIVKSIILNSNISFICRLDLQVLFPASRRTEESLDPIAKYDVIIKIFSKSPTV